jgi:hypothetical protein
MVIYIHLACEYNAPQYKKIAIYPSNLKMHNSDCLGIKPSFQWMMLYRPGGEDNVLIIHVTGEGFEWTQF